MSYQSIAIIKKTTNKDKSSSVKSSFIEIDCNDQGYEFLVIDTGNENYKFFDFKTKIIGAGFDYTSFKNKVLDFLELTNKDWNKFNTEPNQFKVKEYDIPATAYEYELSNLQYDNLDKERNDILWLTENELILNKEKWDKSQSFLFEEDSIFNDVGFSNDFRTDIVNIVKARKKSKLVIFAGAGVSKDSGVPNWAELIKAFQSEIDIKENDYLKVAQLHYDTRRKKENIEKLKDVIQYGKTSYNLIHKQIVNLKPNHIITTNYDNHFEQIVNKDNFKYSIIKKDADLPYAKTNSYFVKMHGDIEEKNVVLKKNEYDDYSKNFPLIKGFVEGIFATQLVLFVGFSFTDPNLQSFLGYVKDILGEDNQPPYLLHIPDTKTIDKETEEHYKKDLKKRGLKIVEYEVNAINSYYAQIEDIDNDKIKSLDATGKKAYKFLKVIEKYDLFHDNVLYEKGVEDQFAESLYRFNDFNSLPTYVLEKISPFIISKSKFTGKYSDAEYNNFNLSILNEKLLNLFNIENKVEAEVLIDESFKSKKTNAALRLLFASGVFYLSRKNDLSSPTIKITPPKPKDCECVNCLLSDYKYGELLIKLNSKKVKTLCEAELKEVNLLDAYTFMKTGQFVNAFYELEKVKCEALKVQNNILFFLAAFNQKRIKGYIHFLNDMSCSEMDFIEIKKRFMSIDLDHVLYEAPFDDDVFKLLVIIKEDTLFSRSRKIILSNLQKLQEIYSKYKNEGFRSMGPNYWREVELNFYNLSNFYRSNFLFNDESDEFVDLAHSYIEAMVVAHQVSDKYSQRLENFYPFFFQTVIDYGIAERTKIIYKTYDFKKFVLNKVDEQTKSFIDSFKSICQSGYRKTEFMGVSIRPNEKFQIAIKNSNYFEYKTKRIFNNFMLLFCKIQISEIVINELFEESINFLSVNETYNASNEHRYFIEFVEYYVVELSDKNIYKLIEYMLSENIWSDALIEPICKSIVEKKKQVNFLGEEYYSKIIRRSEKAGSWNVDINAMIPFYQMFEIEQKNNFFELIKEKYFDENSTKRGVNPYYQIYRHGVWNPIDNEDFFKVFLCQLFKTTGRFPNYDLDDNGNEINIVTFSGLNELNFTIRLIYKYTLFDHEFVGKLYNHIDNNMFKWALKPHDWDYSIFDYKWIVAFGYVSEMFSVISGIDILKFKIKEQLSQKFNPEVAKIYFKYFE